MDSVPTLVLWCSHAEAEGCRSWQRHYYILFERGITRVLAYTVRSVTKLTIVKMAHFVSVFHKFSGDCRHHRPSFKLSLNVAPKVRLSSQTSDCRPNSLTTVDCREQPSTFVCKYSTVVRKCLMIVHKHSTVIRERSTVVRWSCAFGHPLAVQIMGHTGNEFNCWELRMSFWQWSIGVYYLKVERLWMTLKQLLNSSNCSKSLIWSLGAIANDRRMFVNTRRVFANDHRIFTDKCRRLLTTVDSR